MVVAATMAGVVHIIEDNVIIDSHLYIPKATGTKVMDVVDVVKIDLIVVKTKVQVEEQYSQAYVAKNHPQHMVHTQIIQVMVIGGLVVIIKAMEITNIEMVKENIVDKIEETNHKLL